MAVEALFTTETPDLPDNADLTPSGSTATTMTFAVDGTVAGIRFYAPSTVANGTTFTAELWECTGTDGVSGGTGTGTLLASKAVTQTAGAPITAGAWNVINFDTSISVVTTKTYRHAIHNSAGRYTALVGYFATAHSNGNVTGVQSGSSQPGVSGGTVRNGTFQIGAAGTYVNYWFNTPSYMIDTQFEAGSTTVTADGSSAATSTDTASALVKTFGVAASAALSDSTASGRVTVYAAGSSAAMSSDTALVIADVAGRPVVSTSAAFPIVTTSR